MIPNDQLRVIDTPIPAERQSAKRHYGVHPYFTRRPFNVVRQYILHYSREGDIVVDPFGGSGVTAIEAYLENRVGVQNDINPLANFIALGIANLHRGSTMQYRTTLEDIQTNCAQQLDRIESAGAADIERMMRQAQLPPNVELPRTSDV